MEGYVLEQVEAYNKNYTVYFHKNIYNGKYYIGQTGQLLSKRFGKDGRQYKKDNTYFGNAVRKYGWDGFQHGVLKQNLTKEQANYWQTYYINYFQTTDQRYGYNLTKGGQGTVGRKCSQKQLQQLTKNKRAVVCIQTGKIYQSLSAACKENNISRGNLSSVCNGTLHQTGGYHWCFVQEYAEYVIPKRKPIPGPQKSVICIQTGVEYASATQAGKSLDIDPTGIRSVCNHRGNTAGGYHWCYPQEKNQFVVPIHPQYKKTMCVQTEIIYNSIAQAARETGIGSGSISSCCRGVTKTAGGYHWLFLNEEERSAC